MEKTDTSEQATVVKSDTWDDTGIMGILINSAHHSAWGY